MHLNTVKKKGEKVNLLSVLFLTYFTRYATHTRRLLPTGLIFYTLRIMQMSRVFL